MKSGYKGRDPMRDYAEKAIGKAIRGAEGKEKSSLSAAGKIPVRPYKKGGMVKKCNMGGLMSENRPPIGIAPDMPRARGPFEPAVVRPSPMKKGGAPKKMAAGGIGKIRHKEMTKKGKPMKAK